MFPFLYRQLLNTCKWSAWTGMLALILAMLATTADVLARKLAGYTSPGTIDIVQLLVLTATFMVIPYAFITRSHVAVAVLVDKFSERYQHLTTLLAGILGIGIMASLSWFAWQQAAMQLEYGDVSQTIAIPMIWYWIPLIYGCILSTLVCLLISVEAVFNAITGADPRAGITGDDDV